jgi:hypothetical protein
MKRTLAFALLFLPAFGLAQVVAPNAGTLQLFNGKALDGWVAEGVTEMPDPADKAKKVPVWTVQDGNIHCAGKGFGFLRYAKKEFGDFHFHVEYRMLNTKGNNNSGVGIRTVPFDPKKSKETRPSYACYEIQLLNDTGKPPNAHSTGSLYRYVAPKVNVVKPAPEWNVLDIECRGPKIRLTMNGAEILDVDQTTVAAIKNNRLGGYICLQNHGTPIEFRNLWIKEIE